MVESKYFRNVSIASKWFCDYSAISGVRRLSARIQNDTEGTMKLIRLMAYVLLSFILSAVGWAQFGSSVQGTVRDASGAAISTAKVQLRDLGTGVVSQITTSTEGFYRFNSLPIGRYTINVTAPGFKSQTKARQLSMLLITNGHRTVIFTQLISETAVKCFPE